MLRWQTRLVEIQAFEQSPVEAAFDCPDRNVFPVRSLINAVQGAPPSRVLMPRASCHSPAAMRP
jgi:hypothetical protein